MEEVISTLKELAEKPLNANAKNVMVGLDGFVDKIVTPVDKRHGMGENFDPISTIAELGARISAAAGKSANLELFPRFEKLGGNGPIMANAMLALGCRTRYVGALGYPEVHPVFQEFAASTDAISLSDPGITTALEFTDGKVMLGRMVGLDDVSFERIIEVAEEGKFFDLMSRSDLVAMVNWTMIPRMTDIFLALLEKVLPNLPPRDSRQFFFDLTDPRKRSQNDVANVLGVISRFQSHGEVTLGLNYNESLQVAKALGFEQRDPDKAGLRKTAEEIRGKLELGCVVIHPVDSAACATKEGSWWVKGPFEKSPKITTGAGDHFNAGFSVARLTGLSPTACLIFATATSGYYVRTAQSPSSGQIENFLRQMTNDS
ncbi:MAG: PfkB family carbohydrate kinase [Opitutales bacterium]